jgi:hypothetical protein
VASVNPYMNGTRAWLFSNMGNSGPNFTYKHKSIYRWQFKLFGGKAIESAFIIQFVLSHADIISILCKASFANEAFSCS